VYNGIDNTCSCQQQVCGSRADNTTFGDRSLG